MAVTDEELSPVAIRVAGQGEVGINVWDYGGEGPTLLLCHCTGTHARMWDALVPALLPHFRCVAADTRGHGDSEVPADLDAYTWKNSGHDLLAVIDALDLGPDLRAVGHSAGASHVCYASLLRPGVFSRALVMDPIIGPEFPGHENPMAAAARKRRPVFASREAARTNYAAKPPMNAWHPRTLDAYVEFGFHDNDDGSVDLNCPPAVEGELYTLGGASDIFERLGEIEMPITLVTSENSNVRGLVELQREKFSNFTFHVIEDAGHFIPQEKPEAVVELILSHMV